jgi:hypothetical protein
MGRYEVADARCAAMAEVQLGLFTHDQAVAAGHTRGTIRRRLDGGRWTRVLPTVYTIAGTPITWLTRCKSVTLWDPGRVVISGPAGAAIHSIDGFPRDGLIEASTCSSRRPPADWIRLRRVREEVLDLATEVAGIRTESLPRIILNLCGKKHRRREKALDQAIREERLDLGDMWQLIEAEWTTGRRGIRILHEMVRERTPGAALTDSDLEDMYVTFVKRFGLPRGVEQWPMVLPNYGQARFDFGYPLDDSAVEINSYAYHLNDKEGFDRNAQKHRAAKLAGIEIIPITYSDMKWRAEQTAEALRNLLPNSCKAHPSSSGSVRAYLAR